MKTTMIDVENTELPLTDEDVFSRFQSDVLIDIVDEEGVIKWMNPGQVEMLGVSETDARELSVEAIYDEQSVEKIHKMLGRYVGIGFATTLELQMFGRGGRVIRTIARARIVWEGQQRALRLTKIEFGSVGTHYNQLEADFSLLSNIIRYANEAHWAIEFLEPVDTTQSREEIIRQVFENQSIWRMCNPAMSRLYGLPEDMDLNAQSVALYWPRSQENESFVGRIIDGGYSVHDVISVDRKHDGTSLYVLNDVRADVVDGFLISFWGNMRNITELPEAKRELNGEEDRG